MDVELTARDAALFSRLYVAKEDFSAARFCAEKLIQKGWHYKPWERSWMTYQNQAAFTSSMIKSYCRPFTRSKGWPRLPTEIFDFDSVEKELHDRIMRLRHEVFAHSDSSRYKVRPWQSADLSTVIFRAPFLMVTADEAARLLVMIAKLTTLITAKMADITDSEERGRHAPPAPMA